jgi:hypothetical protein
MIYQQKSCSFLNMALAKTPKPKSQSVAGGRYARKNCLLLILKKVDFTHDGQNERIDVLYRSHMYVPLFQTIISGVSTPNVEIWSQLAR